MGIFKKAYTTVLFLAIFLAGMFTSVDFTPTTGFVDIGVFEVAEAEAETQANTNTTNTGTADSNNETQKTFDSVVKFLNSMLGFLTILVSPLIMFAGWLMSPDWVTGDIFGLRQKMYNLWITVSNILYFIYAIFLIVIAIATIFNSKNYGYRTMLPRLFIGIITIPMTWWFVQFIVSTSTAVTATVLKIPGNLIQTSTNETTKTFWEQPVIPRKIEVTNIETSLKTGQQQCKNEGSCVTPKSIVDSSSGIYSPLLIYGYGIFKIQDVKTIQNSGAFDIIKNVSELVNGMVFSAVMMLVFGVLVIALVFILFVRAIKLWMYAIFSPLFSLKFIFRDQWKANDGFSEMFTIKEFVGLAFVPAVIGLALSFGLIVAATISSGISHSGSKDPCDMTKEACTLMNNIMGNPNNKIVQKINGTAGQNGTLVEKAESVTTVYIGGLELEFKGSLEKGAPTNVEKGGTFISGFGTIIVQFIALVFIWTAFMAATKINDGVATLMKPFESFGNELKEMGKHSVKHVPLPVVGNVHGLSKTMEYVQGANSTKLNNAFAASAVGKKFDATYTSTKIEQQITSSINIARDNKTTVTKAADIVQETLKTLKNDDYYKTPKDLQAKTVEYFNKLGSGINDKNREIRIAETFKLYNDGQAYNAVKTNGFAGLANYIKNLTPDQASDLINKINNQPINIGNVRTKEEKVKSEDSNSGNTDNSPAGTQPDGKDQTTPPNSNT